VGELLSVLGREQHFICNLTRMQFEDTVLALLAAAAGSSSLATHLLNLIAASNSHATPPLLVIAAKHGWLKALMQPAGPRY
jgi:hypothetical protein